MSGNAKFNVGSRHTLRGLKRCPACGKYNGNRSHMCRNLECPLRRQILNSKKSMDPIQMVSYTDSKLYSVRIKERECAPRNFVEITDTTLISEVDSSIVSRHAICYVDTCKYDSNDVDISCKHVKIASESIKLAEVFPIQYDTLWSLRIGVEQKVRLWEMYKDDEMSVPAVQRINKTTFVTKCSRSHIFPSGRLHVTALTNESPCKTQTCSCACKRLQILMSPNNSVVLKEDICDHLLLVLAAILSKPSSHAEFSNFTKDLKTFWTLDDNDCRPDRESATGNRDIFIFDNELLPIDVDLSDFTDNILKSVLRDENANSNAHLNMYQGDPSMVSGCTADDADIPFEGIGCGTDGMNDESTHLELSDCNIELMDQFQLTDQIDLCSDEVILSDSDLFQENNIVMPDLSDTIEDDLIVAQNQNHPQLVVPVVPAQVIENPVVTIAAKKPKKVIVAQSTGTLAVNPPVLNAIQHADHGPSLEYVVWLDHIIECINMSIDFNIKDPNVSLSFNVHEDIFAHFSKSFTNGVKCRLPNSTVLVKKGRFKGLLKYTWILRTASKVQRIFSTKNMSVEVERKFQPSGDTYVPYVDEHCDLIVLNKKYKKISPKMCIAHIWFDCSINNHRTGFKIEWVPNVFPKSGFGILNIEFSIGLKK